MRQILIELHIPGKTFGDFYILEHPTYGEADFYRQSISYTWFRDRELNRAFPDLSGKPINGMNWMEYAETIKYCSEHSGYPNRPYKDYLNVIHVDINTVPVCKGVWDFYDKIGYDRKLKKYL